MIVPSVEELEDRFHFIESDILRTNLAISFQYIIFLINIEDELVKLEDDLEELPGAIYYSNYKTILVNTASIVESVLHYGLTTQIQKGEVRQEKVMKKVERFFNDKKTIYNFPDSNQKIVAGRVEVKPEELTEKTQFATISKACKRAGIIDQALFNEVENLRENRNRLHLTALEEREDYYAKETIEHGFSTANKVLKRIEEVTA